MKKHKAKCTREKVVFNDESDLQFIPFKQDVKNGKRTYFLAKPKPEHYTRTKLSVDFEKKYEFDKSYSISTKQ